MNKSKCLIILAALILSSCGKGGNKPSSSSLDSSSDSSISSEIHSETSGESSSEATSESVSSSSEEASSESTSEASSEEVSSSSEASSGSSSESSSESSEESSTSEEVVGDLTFLGTENLTIVKGHYFDPLEGVSVQEDETAHIEVKGYVDYGKVGSYTLRYFASSSLGSGEKTRTIKVAESSYTHPAFNRSRGADRSVSLGSGSYRTGQVPEGPVGDGNQFHLAPLPTNVDTEVLNRGMLPSNQWWSGFAYSNLGGVTLGQLNPLSFGYMSSGLHLSYRGEGFTQYFEVADTFGKNRTTMSNFTPTFQDLFVKPSSLGNDYFTSIIDYDDVSVKIAARNSQNGEDEMVSTFVQGSPFVVSEFKNPSSVNINLRIPAVTQPYRFYDKQGNAVTSSYDGDGLIICLPQAHYGYETTYPSTAVGAALYQDVYYYLSLPSGSHIDFEQGDHPSADFKAHLAIRLGNGNALGVASSNTLDGAKAYASAGQSFLMEGGYAYEGAINSGLKTTAFSYKVRHFGEQSDPLMSLLPHQWKKLNEILPFAGSLPTKRGLTKIYRGSSFSMATPFHGLTPSFAGLSSSLPEMEGYLNKIIEDTVPGDVSMTWQDSQKNYYNAPGPYWCSKALYPLGQGLIIADQMGLTSIENIMKSRLKSLLVDWFTYSGNDDARWLYYDEAVGSLYYSVDNFSTNSRLSDHHFTAGYLVSAVAILAMYDPGFLRDYGAMAKLLLLDYMNYEGNPSYPAFRGFDAYDGHSWADGKGDFGDGNDQESCGEALHSWAAGYFLGAALGEKEMMEAASWGFSLELEGIKQYWFNYDEDNWIPSLADHTHALGIVWGAKNDYATWFGSNPEFIYGIHFLPTGEYLSSYAFGNEEKSMVGKIYQEFLSKVDGAPRCWQSNMWAMQAIYDPATAKSVFDGSKIYADQYADEAAGSYYMVNALNELGQKAIDVELEGEFALTSYIKGSARTILAWNPTGEVKTYSYTVSGVKKEAIAAAHSFTLLAI